MTYSTRHSQRVIFNSRKIGYSLYVFLQMVTFLFSLQKGVKRQSVAGMTNKNTKQTLNEFTNVKKHIAGVAEE